MFGAPIWHILHGSSLSDMVQTQTQNEATPHTAVKATIFRQQQSSALQESLEMNASTSIVQRK